GNLYAAIHRIDCDQNDALPAECLVLVFKPGECMLKMLRIKIWPIFIPDVEIRIYRLHREKTAQSASSSPAYNQIQTRNFIGTQATVFKTSEIPFPAIVDK